MMDPDALSRALRHSTTGSLADRRRIAALSLVAIGSLSVVALYQLGVLTRLPDLPLPGFDSEKVVQAADAYALVSTPDAVLGIASYAGTAGLASMGGPDRAHGQRWLPLALAAKVGFDVYQAAIHSVSQWRRHRALCSWCLVPALATFAMLPSIVPEARVALSRRRGGS